MLSWGPFRPSPTTSEPRPPVAAPKVDPSLPAAPLRVDVGGVLFDVLTQDAAEDYMIQSAQAGRGGWVITANLDHARRAVGEVEYGEMCREADLVLADGMPIVWAAKIQGTPLPERVAGSALTEPLARKAAGTDLSLFILGGTEGTAAAAASLLENRYPGLQIAGTYCPPFGFERDAEQMALIRRELKRTRPALIYVALGSPKQERLIRELRVEHPQAWFIGIGISLSFLIGEIPRAPRWMQATGLEWAHRLAHEPRRLFWRYIIAGLPHAAKLLGGAAVRRMRGVSQPAR